MKGLDVHYLNVKPDCPVATAMEYNGTHNFSTIFVSLLLHEASELSGESSHAFYSCMSGMSTVSIQLQQWGATNPLGNSKEGTLSQNTNI